MGMIGKLLTINTHLTTVLCIAPNSLVICLILTTSHEEIREYRLILAVQSVLEVLTCTMLSLLDLGIVQYRTGVFFVQTGVLSMRRGFVPLFGSVFMIFLFINNIFFLLFIFTFRYAFICNKAFLKRFFTKRGAVVVIGVAMIVSASIAVSVLSIASIRYSSKFDEIFQQSDVAVFSFNVSHTVFGPVIIAILVSLVLLTYGAVFFTSRQIISITTLPGASERTRRLQRQLTVVMMLQALLPFFFIILPLVSLFVFALTPISLGVYASVVAILFNWEPCAHPFIALYFVNSFRKRICRFFSALMLHCIFCRNYLNSPVLTKVQPAPQQLRGERLFASSPSSQM